MFNENEQYCDGNNNFCLGKDMNMFCTDVSILLLILSIISFCKPWLAIGLQPYMGCCFGVVSLYGVVSLFGVVFSFYCPAVASCRCRRLLPYCWNGIAVSSSSKDSPGAIGQQRVQYNNRGLSWYFLLVREDVVTVEWTSIRTAREKDYFHI